MDSHRKQYDVQELLIRLIENDLDDSQRKQLLDWSRGTADAARQYCEFLKDYAVISNFVSAQIEPQYGCSEDSQFDQALWEALLEDQSKAPVVEIPRKQANPKPAIQEVVHPKKPKQKVSKFNILFLVMNIAAILFFVVYIRYAPPRVENDVATVTNIINAKWKDAKSQFDLGSRISGNGKEITLSRGYVELTFDNQTKVFLEAPVDFRILAEDRIGLKYGKIYAIVKPKGIGFSLHTPSSKIIDLGTEFGVEVDIHGNTELSVLKGKTLLLTGNDEMSKVEVTEGIAKKVYCDTGEVVEIQCRQDTFVRKIDSKADVVWRGQSIDLSDIVRNGNGFGTGSSEYRLNYVKGFTKDWRGGETLTTKDYLPIGDNPFIDGIFIPNGKTIVSSNGNVYNDFLWTDGVYSADLIASPDPDLFVFNEQVKAIVFDGQEYSEQGKPCILMSNSNHGITFDLDAIRDTLNIEIDRFEAQVGLADFTERRCDANFYVLVDGELCYSLLEYTQKGILNDISLKIKDTDRFLTLATTENVDQIDYMANSTLNDNWCVFTEPVLVLK